MLDEWRAELSARLAPLRLRAEREAEIIEELSQHLDDEVVALLASGVDAEEARARALAELDRPGALAGRLASIETPSPYALPPPGAPSSGRWFEARWLDLRQSARSLRRAPGFTATVVAVMALTIGPTTAILSIGNWLLWHPVAAVPNSTSLGIARFGVWSDKDGHQGVSPASVSPANVRDLLAASTTMTALTGFSESSDNVAVAGESPERVTTAAVDAAYFDALQVPIRVGRTFRPDEDVLPRGAAVTILADGLARRLFGAAENAVGQRVLVNNSPLEVVGVAPANFRGVTSVSHVSVWYPGATSRSLRHLAVADVATRQTGTFDQFIVTPARGATFADVQAELDVLAPRLAERYPDDNAKFTEVRARVFAGLGPPVLARPVYQRVVDRLMLVGLALLLLGCANLANLLASRAARREPEFAVRRALGAGRARLLQHQLVESCLLTTLGAAAGVGLAALLIPLIVSLALPPSATMPGDLLPVPIDIRVLGITLGLSVVCGALAGLVPAWLSRRADLGSGASHAGPRYTAARSTVQNGLASVQLALSLALVTCALLMVGTMRRLDAADRGFDLDGVTAHYFALSAEGIKGARAEEVLRELTAGVSADPRVQTLSLSLTYPLGFGFTLRVASPAGSASSSPSIAVPSNYVTAGYFSTLGLRTIAGSVFSNDEAMAPGGSDGSPVVISAAMAARFYGDSPAVGRVVTLPAGSSAPARALHVIGVVSDVTTNVIGGTPAMTMYLPLGRMGAAGTSSPILLVRSSLTTGEATALVRRVAGRIDRTITVAGNQALRTQAESEGAERRALAWILSMLGSVACVLAAVGLYGLLSQLVAERTREFGIRIALGARSSQVLASVLRRALGIALPGTIAGLALAGLGASLLDSQIWGMSAHDPFVYGAAAISLLAVALASGALPAYAATRISPVEALRQ